jgi:hypothetical protein
MRRDEALITENDFGGRKKRNPLVSLGNLYASKKHGIFKRGPSTAILGNALQFTGGSQFHQSSSFV